MRTVSTNSAIEWTEATWSVVTGCTRVSPGCQNCYAERLTATRLKGQPKYAGLAVISGDGEARWTREVRLHPNELTAPLKWRKPKRVFVCSMSDLFQEGVPFEFIDKVFAVMAMAPQHTFQVLTKRPERMAAYLSYDNSNPIDIRIANAAFDLRGWQRPDSAAVLADLPGDLSWPLGNVWLGTSVENQEQADKRIPRLLRCPAAVRFLSCEPLLSEIDLRPALNLEDDYFGFRGAARPDWEDRRLHWVIAGGESGPGARPCSMEWIRSIVGQCAAAGVACFVKQLGADPFYDRYGPDHEGTAPQFYHPRLRDRKGGDIAEFPSDLRVRQFPNATEVSHA